MAPYRSPRVCHPRGTGMGQTRDTNANVAECVIVDARIKVTIVRDLSAENRARGPFSIDIPPLTGEKGSENV